LRYSTKFREKLITKALRPNISVTEAAQEAGISRTTLYAWIAQAKLVGMSKKKKQNRGRPRKSSRWSPEEKLRILSESAALSDEELGAFWRREGLHDTDLYAMRESALAGLKPPATRRGPSPEEKEIKKLQKELRRKEKALAEAAALLILQKKFQTLMADEDDDMGGNFGDDS